MADDGLELPIFELPAVILPGELLPLHIFEDRYVRMIGHCLDASEPFGIVFRDDEGTAHRIGCTARVQEVVERFEDVEYPAGEVEPIDPADEPGEEDPDEADATRSAFAELVERVSGEAPEAAELETDDSYSIAARVELPSETKQALLEQRSELERMRMLGNALRALVTAVARSREIAERAKMNGKVAFR